MSLFPLRSKVEVIVINVDDNQYQELTLLVMRKDFATHESEPSLHPLPRRLMLVKGLKKSMREASKGHGKQREEKESQKWKKLMLRARAHHPRIRALKTAEPESQPRLRARAA
ncbi:hypothetical protein PIB30_037043 [Stylosanthes scabra]|uniref:Uncharacterized protein n=1 Tax=Stylosanthes scabra TaxID=79078 RepID=A0ABU6TEN7_9FABA|nr:hypothetical protein [Stylosanthes scabra]